MSAWTVDDVERWVRESWGEDTCAPEDQPRWTPRNPARGQCGVTALVVHDLLGGDLMVGEVQVDGQRVDFHWWNRLADGTELDLTREQFEPHESVSPGLVVRRPPEIRRLRAEYELLRDRVLALLSRTEAGCHETRGPGRRTLDHARPVR